MGIPLKTLAAQFMRIEKKGGKVHFVPVKRIEDAQGVIFICPKCFAANGGARGTHSIICWSRSRGVPDDIGPKPSRWKLDGTGIADLTLNADPPSTARSVQLNDGCNWHGFVTNGETTDA